MRHLTHPGPFRGRTAAATTRYVALVSVVVASTALAVHASPAAAGVVSLVCTGSQQAHYAPGITNTPRDVKATVNAVWDDCLAQGAGLTQGHGTFRATNPNATCLVAASIVANVVTYNWNNGGHSDVNFHTTAPTRLANGTTVLTSVGTVTNGFGQGATATRTSVLPQTDVDKCSEPGGLTQLDGPATLTFSP